MRRLPTIGLALALAASVLFSQLAVLGGPAASAASVPGAPTGVTATDSNTTVGKEALVSWTPPTNNGGSAITGYKVFASPGDKTCGAGAGGAISCVVKGLTNGTAYTFTAVALNANGQSAVSAPSNAFTPQGLPGPPRTVTGTPGNGQVQVSWNKPSGFGTMEITGYTATSSPEGRTCISNDVAISKCTITGLTNGTAYTFTVIATNRMGNSPASLPSAPITPSSVLYVDGKNGSDTNNGACMVAKPSTCGPLKTIRKASELIPSGAAAGWKVIVRGYTDHIYRMDRVHKGFSSFGSPGNPIVFQAEGWTKPGDKGFVRPIVDGSMAAPLAGQSWRSEGSGVFSTHWPTKPSGWLAKGASGDSASAVFQDFSKYLWNRKSVTDLQARRADGGYFWDSAGKRLYVAPLGGTVSGRSFDVISDNTFYFKGEMGVRHILVAGFRIQHSDVGIGFVNGMDYGEAYDNETLANLYMGIHTNGRMVGGVPDPSVGHKIRFNLGKFNTVQMMKISFGTEDTVIDRNIAEGNALQGIKVQGTPANGPYTGPTRNIKVTNNTLRNQTYKNPDRGPSDNASGLTIANGAQQVIVKNNRISGNGIGIHFAQEGVGPVPMNGIVIEGNRIFSNRRFGLNIFDGRYNATAGSGRLTARRNLYWDNYIGVMVDQRTSNKKFEYETIFRNTLNGLNVNGRGVGTNVRVEKSLITDNGRFGALVSKAGVLYLRYAGLAGNGTAATRVDGGTLNPAKSHFRNTRPASYLSTDPTSPNFLKIDSSSFQFTAGPNRTPIGARF